MFHFLQRQLSLVRIIRKHHNWHSIGYFYGETFRKEMCKLFFFLLREVQSCVSYFFLLRQVKSCVHLLYLISTHTQAFKLIWLCFMSVCRVKFLFIPPFIPANILATFVQEKTCIILCKRKESVPERLYKDSLQYVTLSEPGELKKNMSNS